MEPVLELLMTLLEPTLHHRQRFDEGSAFDRLAGSTGQPAAHVGEVATPAGYAHLQIGASLFQGEGILGGASAGWRAEPPRITGVAI